MVDNMINLAGNMPPEMMAEQQQLNRQQRLADLLTQQGLQQMPAGSMVSGRYVPTSPFQHLAQIANIAAGQYVGKKSDEQALKLAQAVRGKQQEAVQDYMQAMQGTPSQAGNLPLGTTGQAMGSIEEPMGQYQAPVAAQGPNYMKAFEAATRPLAPAPLQSAGYEMLKPQKLAEGETLNRFNFATGQLAPYASGGEKLPTEYKEYQKAISDPINPFKGSFFQYQQELKQAGANRSTVNMPPVESAYNKVFGEKIATQDANLKDIAEGAQLAVSNIARQKKILEGSNFFSGKTANIQNELANYGTALGITGKNGQEKAANTQTLISGGAGITLDSIKGSGLGAGQGFTDKDLRFLEDAKSFKITWNKENIARVLDLQERAAIEGAKKWNARQGLIQKSATVPINVGQIEVPTPYSGTVKYLGNE